MASGLKVQTVNTKKSNLTSPDTSTDSGICSDIEIENGTKHERLDQSTMPPAIRKEQIPNLVEDVWKQYQRKDSGDAQLVFCLQNVAMTVALPKGCSLELPDKSVKMIIPEGALARATVIYVFKEIKATMPSGRIVAPRLYLGQEGTTFNRPVILISDHRAVARNQQITPNLVVFKSPTRDGKELDEQQREQLLSSELKVQGSQVILQLKSFSVITICSGYGVGRKMCCLYGSTQQRTNPLTTTTVVYIALDDIGVIQHVRDELIRTGCAAEDIHFVKFMVWPDAGDVFFSIRGCENSEKECKIQSHDLLKIGFGKVGDIFGTKPSDEIVIRQPSTTSVQEDFHNQNEVYFDENQIDPQYAEYIAQSELPLSALAITSNYQCAVQNGQLTDDDQTFLRQLNMHDIEEGFPTQQPGIIQTYIASNIVSTKNEPNNQHQLRSQGNEPIALCTDEIQLDVPDGNVEAEATADETNLPPQQQLMLLSTTSQQNSRYQCHSPLVRSILSLTAGLKAFAKRNPYLICGIIGIFTVLFFTALATAIIHPVHVYKPWV